MPGGMRKADPKAVGDFTEKLLNSGDYRRLIRGRYFRATVASVAGSGGSYSLTIIRNGETTPDGDLYQSLVPGYVPRVGDDVEMVWRDESNAVVAYPVNRGTGSGATLDITTNFSGIGAVETDLSGYSVTVPTPGNRMIRVSAYIPSVTSTVAGDFGSLRLYQDGVLIQRADKWFGSVSLGQDQQSTRVMASTSGAHIYKATYQRSSGSGTFTSFAGGLFTVEVL
jgi:hypothetical protein